MKEAVSKIPGVTFRRILDQEGDSATFLAFFLPDAETAGRINRILADNAAGAIYFAKNTWHYYPQWEHLLNGASLSASGWPFKGEGGRRRVIYDPQVLPQSARIMDRLLVYQVPVKLADQRLAEVAAALHKAAAAV